MAALVISAADVGDEVYFLYCGPKNPVRALSSLQGE